MAVTAQTLSKKDLKEALVPVLNELKELRRESSLWKIETKAVKVRVDLMEHSIRRLVEDFLLLKDKVEEQMQDLKRQFLTMAEPIMYELKGIREDSAAQSMVNEDLEKSIHDHEKRITRLETTS
ncbi:hypothetical protein HYZ78_02580 [Candidatus Microgenomates bacterium]|nr:hypothetical protein [Candidatus Microgenomates bacterium]